MKKVSMLLATLVVVLFVLQDVRDETGRWAVGLRAGPSFFTQDVIQDVKEIDSDVGPLVAGSLLYRVNEIFSVGFEIEWESHGVDIRGLDWGSASAISLLPFVEVHLPASERISPYLCLGFGYNINSLSPSDTARKAAADLFGADYDAEVDDSLAVKAGLGLDWFVSDRVALNGEAAWKLNKGDAAETLDGVAVNSGDFNGSSFALRLGVRVFF
ncbi:MAG: outer membrane beta-barrel protein [Thermodesulfobacteriota bacterium]